MTRPLRVLAIHRFYWPDTPPYASLLRAIVARWHSDGHQVSVLSSQPSYKPETTLAARPSREEVDGVMVHRISMKADRSGGPQRLINLVRFPLIASWRVLVGPPRDVVMCSTAPQVTLGALVSLAARIRGARFVYHCMDLHPEIGRLSGEFAHPLVYRALMALDKATCRRASVIIVLSDDMRRAVERRDPSLADRIVVLNNFELPSFEGDLGQVPLTRPQDRVRIAFTGNLGRFQGLEAITRTVLADDDALDGLELVLMGEGSAKKGLQEMVAAVPPERRDRVRFVPHGSPADAKALLRDSDYGLVSLTPGVIEFAYPSKTATYLSEGVPLLVAVEPESELVLMVEREGLGRHLPSRDEAMVGVLVDMAASGPTSAYQRARALAHWQSQFSAEHQLQRWSALLDDCEGNAA